MCSKCHQASGYYAVLRWCCVYRALAGQPTPLTEMEGEQFLEAPLNISILVFISPKHPLQFTLEFRDLDYVDYRDTLDVSNYAATHYKVRGGISSNTSHPLHLMVSEGWNRLRLVADNRHLSLKWIDENDEADLLALTLDFPLNIMTLKGFFSVCFGDSPEWDVGDGQQTTVPLHPLKSEQQLVVTGQASLMPYLITDSGPIPIVTNTTLTVKIRRQNSTSVIKIVQEGLELLSMQQSLRPVITVGSKGGNTHLRLSLSDPQEEQEHSRGPHPESQTITNKYIAIIGVLAGENYHKLANTGGKWSLLVLQLAPTGGIWLEDGGI
ncbi:hypothetical protein GWK47_050437 [Chionoecetes opilio]|uniref:Uncharacterized protein n=1 Tax=Chionoecetes opilio TaxID=41210 RepID=A0A8J4Y2M2_CHIOP|nr:hypothetical protein GWK47_050437 [Chionoecetes opilio]